MLDLDTLDETAAYIAARLSTAGGDSRRLFSREAIALIHERSGGIPRLINVVCDNALLTGFGLGRALVDRATVLEVTHDFDLAAEPVVCRVLHGLDSGARRRSFRARFRAGDARGQGQGVRRR